MATSPQPSQARSAGGLFWAPGQFTFLIPGAKIDGRGHVREETVDECWSDNFLMIGKGFGQSFEAAPKMKNGHTIKGKKQLSCAVMFMSLRPRGCLGNNDLSERRGLGNAFDNMNPQMLTYLEPHH